MTWLPGSPVRFRASLALHACAVWVPPSYRSNQTHYQCRCFWMHAFMHWGRGVESTLMSIQGKFLPFLNLRAESHLVEMERKWYSRDCCAMQGAVRLGPLGSWLSSRIPSSLFLDSAQGNSLYRGLEIVSTASSLVHFMPTTYLMDVNICVGWTGVGKQTGALLSKNHWFIDSGFIPWSLFRQMSTWWDAPDQRRRWSRALEASSLLLWGWRTLLLSPGA